METGEPLKHRLIKIYEKGDEGGRTLIYVGRTAKTLEKYVEMIHKYEKVEGVIKPKYELYMYEKGLEKFEYEMDEKEYETKGEAEAAKAAVIGNEKPRIDSTMSYNRKKASTEKSKEDSDKKYVRVNGKMLVFKVDPIEEAKKAIIRGEKAKKYLESLVKEGEEAKKKISDTEISE